MTAIAAGQLQHDTVHFDLVGDSADPNGGVLTMFGLSDLYGLTSGGGPGAYGDLPTDIYTLEYDGWADFPRYVGDLLSVDNALLGTALEYLRYLGLTPADIAGASTETVGSVDYHDIPSQLLPILSGYLLSGPVAASDITPTSAHRTSTRTPSAKRCWKRPPWECSTSYATWSTPRTTAQAMTPRQT